MEYHPGRDTSTLLRIWESQQTQPLATTGTARSAGRFGNAASGGLHAVLGLTQHNSGGRVAVYGDSNCLDSSHMRSPCFRLLAKLLQYVATVGRSVACTHSQLVYTQLALSEGRCSLASWPQHAYKLYVGCSCWCGSHHVIGLSCVLPSPGKF